MNSVFLKTVLMCKTERETTKKRNVEHSRISHRKGKEKFEQRKKKHIPLAGKLMYNYVV
jgi:hypothetical protein